MNQLTEIIVSSATGILAIVAGMIVHDVKKYLIAKGGKRAVEITEIYNCRNSTCEKEIVQELLQFQIFKNRRLDSV